VEAGSSSPPTERATTNIGSRCMLVSHCKNRNMPQRTPLKYEGKYHSGSSVSPEIRIRGMPSGKYANGGCHSCAQHIAACGKRLENVKNREKNNFTVG